MLNGWQIPKVAYGPFLASIYAATAVGSSSAAATGNMAMQVKMTRVERQADDALLAYFSEV